MGADEGGVREGTPVKGGNAKPDGFFEGSIKVSRKDEEQEVVGEEGDDEGVNKEDLLVKGEGSEDGTVEGKTGQGFGGR